MDAFIAEAMNSLSLPEFALVMLTKPCDEVFVKGAVKPILHWIDPSLDIIQVKSHFNTPENSDKQRQTHVSCTRRALVPAISIMLFLPEYGEISYRQIREIFSRPPWVFHHKIELSSKRTPAFNIARQEYFELKEGHPLWSVNPVHLGREHIRICLFAKNFHEMVEFYRFVTDREMESTKPGFCTFVLHSNTRGGLEVQLTLKYSPNISPLTLESTFLCFQLKDVRFLHPLYQKEITRLKGNTYKMADPDGNCIILQEYKHDKAGHQELDRGNKPKNSYYDANSESQDSGRGSNNGTERHQLKSTKRHSKENTSDLETCSQSSLANSGSACGVFRDFEHCDKREPQGQTYDEVWL